MTSGFDCQVHDALCLTSYSRARFHTGSKCVLVTCSGLVERSGAVVECRPHDQEVVGSIPGQITT
jgi:hypothetical protein